MSAVKQTKHLPPRPEKTVRTMALVPPVGDVGTENVLFRQLVNRDDLLVAFLLILPALALFALMASRGVSILEPDSSSLVDWGANYAPQTLGGQYWRWFTATILHIGFVHLAVNTAAIFRIAPLVNAILGPRRTALIYVCSGIAGSLATTLFSPNAISAGASGAIMGLYGAFFPVILLHPTLRKMSLGAVGSIGFFVLMVLANGFTHPNIGNAAHLGGFVFGLLGGYLVSAQDGHVTEKFLAVLTAALCAFTASVAKRDVNPLQLAADFDKQFAPGRAAIARVNADLRAGHEPTKITVNDLENALQLLNGVPEKAQALYAQARWPDTKSTIAAILAQIYADRIYLTGMIASARFSADFSNEGLKSLGTEADGFGQVFSRLSANLLSLKQAEAAIRTDLETTRQLAEENKLDAAAILSSSGGLEFLNKLQGSRSLAAKMVPQSLSQITRDVDAHMAQVGQQAQRATGLAPEQLRQAAADANRGLALVNAVLQPVSRDSSLRELIEKDAAAAEAAKRLRQSQRSLGFYVPYFTMIGFWKEHTGTAPKPEDLLFYRDNVMDKFVTLRGLLTDQDALDPANAATLAAMQSTMNVANCLQTEMAKGPVPAWDEKHPGTCGSK